MVILGLALIVIGALVIVAATFTARIEAGQLEFLGLDTNAITLFLLGVAAGAAILWGLAILKYGTKRSLRQRREARVDRNRDRQDPGPDAGPPGPA